MEDELEREQQVLTAAIDQLKRARKQARGEITTLADVMQLLQGDAASPGGRREVLDSVCERLSVVMDALAFHASELCEHPESVHGVVRIVSEIRQSLREQF